MAFNKRNILLSTSNMEYSFQKMKSEWDDRLITNPVSTFDQNSPRPGMFGNLMTRYIDFEVNNHEAADALRKLIFGIFIGTLITGWILLGIFVGALPLKWMFGSGRKSFEKNSTKVRNVGDEENTLSELADRVTIALDSNWLKKLEDRVKNDSRGSWIKTHARCCVLPKDQTVGKVECQLIRDEKDDTDTFKCLSKLVYNFQFGPNSDINETTLKPLDI